MTFRLHRLASEPETFEPIDFHEGVNIILGERSEKTGSGQGQKVNGVGKTIFVDFLHFALCRSFEKTRVSLIPKGVLPDDLVVTLDLSISGIRYQIRRGISSSENPEIHELESGKKQTFATLDDANHYLGSLLFGNDPLANQTSFRQLMSLLMRDEASGFRDYLNPMPAKNRATPPIAPHVFLMGVDASSIARYERLEKELSRITTSISELEKIITDNKRIKMADLPALINKEEQTSQKIQKALEQLKTDPAFEAVEEKLIEIEAQLLKLRSERKRLAWQIDQIKIIPPNEQINSTDIKIVYDRIKGGLGDIVVKSLEQAQEFKREIATFQQNLVNDELVRLENDHRLLQSQIGTLSAKHQELVEQIDGREILSELKNGLIAATEQNESFQRLSSQYEIHQRQKGEKARLKLRLETQLQEVRDLAQSYVTIQKLIEERVVAIHQRLMSSPQASLQFIVAETVRNKKPLTIDVRTKSDGSKSIDEARVLIYDFALLTANHKASRHPGFLLHDNILEVDNDTLIQSLNFLGELEDSGHDFQYILTLNEDKIEPKEIASKITLDIESHTRSRYSKQIQFLKQEYQQL